MARSIFDNALLFDGERDPFHGAIMIEDDRILWTGMAFEAPGAPDDHHYDLGGRMLMPGLISCHLHPDNLMFGLANFLAGEQLGKERPPGFLMAVGVRTCRTLLESGFTGYVGAACSHNIDEQLRMAIAEDVIPGPRIRPCSHHIGTTADNNDSPKWWHDFRTPGIDRFADGPDDLRRLVRDEIRCGARIIKFYASSGQAIPDRHGTRNMSRSEMAAIVETAHERGVPVRAHVVDRDLILECLDLGVDVIDHGNELDEECITRMAASGTFWVPSLLYSRVALDRGADPDGPYGTGWNNVRRMIPKAHAAGVRMLIGDDYGGGSMRHDIGVYARELSLYCRETGLSPRDVLRWGTADAGLLLAGRAGEVGILRPGAYADMLVLSENPLEDISVLEQPQETIAEVIHDGRFLRGTLAAIPYSIRASASRV